MFTDAQFLKAMGVAPDLEPEPMVPAVRWAAERDAKDTATRAAIAWCEEAKAHHTAMVFWRALAMILTAVLVVVLVCR